MNVAQSIHQFKAECGQNFCREFAERTPFELEISRKISLRTFVELEKVQKNCTSYCIRTESNLENSQWFLIEIG